MSSTGKYNKRLTIEQPITTQDAAGAPVVAWQALGTGVWASIEPLKGREALTAHQTLAALDTRIHLRYHPALAAMNEKWRCSYNGVIYNINSVVNVGMANREFELLCTSGVNNG